MTSFILGGPTLGIVHPGGCTPRHGYARLSVHMVTTMNSAANYYHGSLLLSRYVQIVCLRAVLVGCTWRYDCGGGPLATRLAMTADSICPRCPPVVSPRARGLGVLRVRCLAVSQCTRTSGGAHGLLSASPLFGARVRAARALLAGHVLTTLFERSCRAQPTSAGHDNTFDPARSRTTQPSPSASPLILVPVTCWPSPVVAVFCRFSTPSFILPAALSHLPISHGCVCCLLTPDT